MALIPGSGGGMRRQHPSFFPCGEIPDPDNIMIIIALKESALQRPVLDEAEHRTAPPAEPFVTDDHLLATPPSQEACSPMKLLEDDSEEQSAASAPPALPPRTEEGSVQESEVGTFLGTQLFDHFVEGAHEMGGPESSESARATLDVGLLERFRGTTSAGWGCGRKRFLRRRRGKNKQGFFLVRRAKSSRRQERRAGTTWNSTSSRS